MDNTGIAEAYMLRRLITDKMKKKSLEGSTHKPQPQVTTSTTHQRKISNGCFYSVFKKIHPTDVSLLDSVGRN
ncbi:hypothetical protein HYC85_008236 [Camellia sinensis]|uniref:Uncharacterized protein n=1 Tax=Camellia sinensis TaxID=4442 RepID=A0A7J7HR81_CAMSI|nr:hypothetical protein HYC85_008236 [Camellia sinensis]